MEIRKINIGCGTDIKEGWDNVDRQKDEKLTKSFDLNIYPYPIENDTYDYALLSQILEHLDKPDEVLYELHRICKKNGVIRIEVPYYNNKGAFDDITHFHYFNDKTFINFVNKAAMINDKKKFKIIKLELTPTVAGYILPNFIRKKLSLFISGLISQVHIELKVLK